jgi:hypothetical protein
MATERTGKTVELSREAWEKVMTLAAEYDGDIDKLAADARKGRKSVAGGVAPKTAGEVVALKDAGIINQTEARKYLGLRPSARALTAPRRRA